MRTTKPFGESTVSKILELVENSGSRKSHSEQFISRFARVYTPIVCYAALALALLPPLVRILFMSVGGDWTVWIYRALTFLIVSCPCALVISIPLSFFAGLGGASSEGVLIKGSNFLEALAQTKTVVFDKTGTLTKGVFEVSGIHHCPIEDKKLLEYAALAECASSHPISKSLQRAYGRELDRSRVSDIEEISGNGVIAKVDGHSIAAGNDRLMQRLGIGHTGCHSVGTIVHVAIDGVYSGHIVISDIVKPDSAKAIEELKKAGVSRTVMLTGDAKAVADKVASELGVDEVHSQLLPGDKVRCNGLGRRNRGRRRCSYGRRSSEDIQGDQNLAQVHPHRLREHHFRSGRKVFVPAAGRSRRCGYGRGDLRRRRSHGHRRPQRHACSARKRVAFTEQSADSGLL